MKNYDKAVIESTINSTVDRIFQRVLYCVDNKINKDDFGETSLSQLKQKYGGKPHGNSEFSFIEKSGEEYFGLYNLRMFFPPSKLDKIRTSATGNSVLNSIFKPVGARGKLREASDMSAAVIEFRISVDSLQKYFGIKDCQKAQEEAAHDANMANEIEKVSNIVSALSNSPFLTDMAKEIDVVSMVKHAVDWASVTDDRTSSIQIFISNHDIQWKDSICERIVVFERKGYRRLCSKAEVLAVCKALCDYAVHSIEAQGDMHIQHREKYYYYPDPNSDIAARASFIITVIGPSKEPFKDIF